MIEKANSSDKTFIEYQLFKVYLRLREKVLTLQEI
jgi:hypothetical protein